MKYLFIILLSVATLFQTNAQNTEAIATALESTPSMEVTADLLKFTKGTQNGFTAYLNAPLDMAVKKWKNYMESKYMVETKKSKNTVVCEDAKLAPISQTPITVTAIFSDDENGCKIDVFYKLSGSFINPKDHPTETAVIKESLKEYQKELYVGVFQNTLDEQRKVQDKEQKALEKLQKEGEGITKDISDEEADINKAEQEIIDAEKRISELQAKMQALKGEIQQSRATIEELRQASSKKKDEIEDQARKVSDQTKRIERIKSSSDKLGN